MAMPGRTYAAPGSLDDKYRYSHNGQEKDNDIFIGALSAEYWEYDSRTGRRWENDPLTYEWQSPYATFNNNSIYFADPAGLEGESVQDDKEKGEGKKAEPCATCEGGSAQKEALKMNPGSVSDGHGGIVVGGSPGKTTSPDAKTQPENNTGSNPTSPENKNKNPEPANEPTAQNKESNGSKGLINNINLKKHNISDFNPKVFKSSLLPDINYRKLIDKGKNFSDLANVINGTSTELLKKGKANHLGQKLSRLSKKTLPVKYQFGTQKASKLITVVAKELKTLGKVLTVTGVIFQTIDYGDKLMNGKAKASDHAAMVTTGLGILFPGFGLIWGGTNLIIQKGFGGKSLEEYIFDH